MFKAIVIELTIEVKIKLIENNRQKETIAIF